MKNTKPKEILENIINVMEKTRVDDWEIDKLVVVLNYINELENNRDKAMEYIKELCMFINKDGKECYLHYGDDLSPNYLINILRGEDNDNNIRN